MIDFERYAPQRIFLIQGDSNVYEGVIEQLEAKAPLVHGMSIPRLTMDHAHSIASFATEGDGTARYMVVHFSVFSPDAAQVLLKSLEEPDMFTTVIFVTPYPYLVPLTIRSRVLLLAATESIEKKETYTKAKAQAFIQAELSGESDDDAATRRAKAVAFLDALEVQMRGDPQKARYIYEAKDMLFGANMPTKYVAEYVVTAVL